MNLFQCPSARIDIPKKHNTIQTPLGNIRLDAMLDGVMVGDIVNTQTSSLQFGGWVTSWHQQNFDLELLICRPILSLPSQIQLADCWAGIWRFYAKNTIGPCNFTATWEKGHTWKDSKPESSQWVYAKTWYDEQIEVSIATDDNEALAIRSIQSDGLPREWEAYFHSTTNQFDWFSLQSIHYDLGDKGLPIPLPSLEAGQQCQLHFILSWASCEDTGAAASIGSDLKPSEILTGAGCFQH